MIKLSKGQAAVLGLAATPMAAVGVAGAVATYVNMDNVLHRGASALGLVAAGEGATLICALVALAVTLMGQHTPATVRLGMWLVPLAASAVGIALAPTATEAVVMAFTPLAMTAAGEGVAFVARRVVAYRTGTDIEQQRRSGLLLWHANRAANGRGLGKRISRAAVWRLTRSFAATDGQLSVQLGEIQRFRIGQGADVNLAAVLGGGQDGPAAALQRGASGPAALAASEDTGGYRSISQAAASGDDHWDFKQHFDGEDFGASLPEPDGLSSYWTEKLDEHLAETMAEADQAVRRDPSVKLLTTGEVAELKGVRPGTVRSWKSRGKLPATLVDGIPMYHPADVAALD
jgi:hypothetical protein